MKSNEAPEKIYLFENTVSDTPDNRWLSKRSDDKDVEYIRKDSFIKKACVYLQRNLWRVVNEEPDFRQRFVTDFRNYMED
jgi:hypothetical protein